MEQKKTCIVDGSYGDLTVDVSTGVVLNYDPRGQEALYSNIKKFDIEDYVNYYGQLTPHIDILYINFWNKDGKYIKSNRRPHLLDLK